MHLLHTVKVTIAILALLSTQNAAPSQELSLTEGEPGAFIRCFSPEACTKLGIRYRDGDGVTKRFDYAWALLSSACQDGYKPACGLLGFMYINGHGVDRNVSSGTELVRVACDINKPTFCILFVDLIENASSDIHFKLTKKSVYSTRCKSGDIVACASLEAIFQSEPLVSKETAFNYLQSKCEADNLAACLVLASAYSTQRNSLALHKKAFTIAKKCCESEFKGGCHLLGLLYEVGRGTKKNIAKSIQHLEKSCTLGVLAACERLAKIHHQGIGTPVDVGRSHHFLRMMCRNNSSKACLLLGKMYQLGFEVEKNQSASIDYFHRSCNLGSRTACSNVLTQLARDLGNPGVGNLYFEIAARGCLMRSIESCVHLSRAFFFGITVNKDENLAASILRPLCEGEYPSTCVQLSEYHQVEGSKTEDEDLAILFLLRACNASINPSYSRQE